MKNKEKMKKIVDTIFKIALAILIAFVAFILCMALFKSCKADTKYTAYASETDGIGTWVWNASVQFSIEDTGRRFTFSFISNNTTFFGIMFDYIPMGGPIIDYYSSFDDSMTIFDDTSWLNEAYQTIDIKTAPPADFLTILKANAVYQGGSEPEPTTYTVTKSISNGTMPGGAETIQTGGSANYQIAPNNGYTFPNSVQVINAEHTYNSSTGEITISNPTGNVTISVLCPKATVFPVFNNITNGTFSVSYTSLSAGASNTWIFKANAGYELPETVSVVGAQHTYTNNGTDAALVVSNPTADVYITINCPMIVSPANIVVGKYTFKNTITKPPTELSQEVNFYTLNENVRTDYKRITMGFNSADNLLIWYYLTNTSYRQAYVADGFESPQYQTIYFGDNPQEVSAEFYNWLTENTVHEPPVTSTPGYQQGYNEGFQNGTNVGYTEGYNVGKNEGYKLGYADGLNAAPSTLHGSEAVIAGTSNLFTIPIFGTFSMLDCLLVVFGIGVAIWFLKMFAGG